MSKINLDINFIVANATAGQSQRLLKFLGVPEISYDFLQKMYGESSVKFYKYLDFNVKKFKAKTAIYEIQIQETLDNESLLVYIEELRILVKNITTIQRFLSLLKEQNEILCFQQEYAVLKQLFLACLNDYYDKFVNPTAEEATVVEDTVEDTKTNENLDHLKPNITHKFRRLPDSEIQGFVSSGEVKERTQVRSIEPVICFDQRKYQYSLPSKSLSDVTTSYDSDRSSIVETHTEYFEHRLQVEGNQEEDCEDENFSDAVLCSMLSETSTPVVDEETKSYVDLQTKIVDQSLPVTEVRVPVKLIKVSIIDTNVDDLIEVIEVQSNNYSTINFDWNTVMYSVGKSFYISKNVGERYLITSESNDVIKSSESEVSKNTVDEYSKICICYIPNLPKVQPTDTPPPSSLVRFIMMDEIDKSRFTDNQV